MRWIISAGLLSGALLVGGCAHTMTAPPNFVAVDKADLGIYDYRAVSADGAVLALRSVRNRKEGTLEFWTQAVINQLTAGQGYKLAESESVKSDARADGRLLKLTAQRSGATFRYLVAIFISGDDILIAEAGGKEDVLKPRMQEIRGALLSAK